MSAGRRSDEASEPEAPTTQEGGPICTPCRGTGRLISSLGGEAHEVTCPWCRGTGTRIPGIDAQQYPAETGTTETTAETGTTETTD